MIEYIEEVIPPKIELEKVVKRFSKAICDCCGKETVHGSRFTSNFATDNPNWHNFSGSEDSSDLTISIGKKEICSSYEGYDIFEEHFEICNECYDDKVVPYLESIGAKKYKMSYVYYT